MLKFLANSVAALSLFAASVASAMPVQMQNAPIRDFVEWYASHSGLSVAVGPGVSGNLTVYSQDVQDSELDAFFLGVLNANGYDLMAGEPSVVVPSQSEPAYSQSGFVGNIQAPPPIPRSTRIYKISNVRASDVAGVVEVFLARSTTQTSAIVNGGLATLGTSVDQTRVTPVAASNTLAVNATAQQFEQLDAFLPLIDIQTPQVLIESAIIETSEGDSFDFSLAAGRARSGSTLAGGANTSALGSSLSSVGASFGIFDGDFLALAIRAARTDSNARLLSTPRVLTLSGSRGSISVGQNVPFVTGRATGVAADINSPFQTIERRDVGVSLIVSPVVTPSGLVICEVTTSANSISDSRAASDIITNQRSISSTVQVRSGDSVLLGGLISDSDNSSTSAVPVLSSIPIIGGLFTSRSDSSSRRVLNVVMRVTVLEPM